MSAATDDQKSPAEELLERVPYPDLDASAAETPLTPEAVVHLRAAGAEINTAFETVRAILRTVHREIHPWAIGADVTIDEDRAYDLSLLLEHAIDMADRKMVWAVFGRGRGERPHGGIVDSNLEEAS